MSTAIEIEGIAKEYRIQRNQGDTMLRERLVNMFRSPLRRKSRSESLWALKDVSFDVEPGEVVGIIGRNGAGKSTLLKILSKITYPTRGRFGVRGRVASLLEVGTGFHEELTGRENVFLNGSSLGMTRAEVQKKFDAIVAFSGVERFLDTPIKRYSSGMRVRLGFAVAAHVDPDVLIVDEVLAVGDAAFQKKCLDSMQDLRSGGRTVLFVSHHMAAVENLCSRGIWIEGGEVKMDGPTSDVIAAYMGSFATIGHAREFGDVKGRYGTGQIRFEGVEFLDADGNPKSVVRCGDGLTIRLRYRAREPIPFPSFGVRIFTELGTLITDASTTHYGIQIPLLPAGEGDVDLEFGPLNLSAARYTMSLFVTTGAEYKICDALEHCTILDVEVADVYGSGKPVEARHGVVYFDQKWKLCGKHISGVEVV